MTFPPEVLLPSSYYVQCEGDSNVGTRSCVKAGTRELKITFANIDSAYDPATEFYLYVYNVYNPVSFKPSS